MNEFRKLMESRQGLHRALRNKGLWFELPHDELIARLERENRKNQALLKRVNKLIREHEHERTRDYS